MRNALIQGAKNLKLVVLEDKALMSEFVRVDWGGVAVVAMNSKRLKASAVPGKPIGMINEEKVFFKSTAVESFIK